MLYQYILALSFSFGVIDVMGRVVTIALGIGTVFFTYKIGDELYGRKTGLIAALFLALMPYHVIVTRQVLLDGPMTFFATGVLYLDFDGEEGPHAGWGSFDAAAYNTTNPQIRAIWERVAEDFAPFNLNVTTDLNVFLAAPWASLALGAARFGYGSMTGRSLRPMSMQKPRTGDCRRVMTTLH